MKNLMSDARGIAHVAMVLLVVVVLGGIGFAGYTVMNKSKKSADLSQTLKEAFKACDKEEDEELCRFFSNLGLGKEVRVTTKTTENGVTRTSLYESSGGNWHTKSEADVHFEMIAIGNTNYTYDPGKGVWWKSTASEATDDIKEEFDNDLSDPAEDKEVEEDKAQYVSRGKEACGSFMCFKYEIVDPSTPEEKNFVWFDDKEYLIRRSLTEYPEGNNDVTYEYTDINISEPSPVQELGPNQVFMPGQSEPMDMPSEEEMQQLMQQYSQ